MNRLLAASICIGCLLIAVGILLRGHPSQGPTVAQYEELKLRLQSLELRAKSEDAGLITRIESDSKAQAYAQVAYDGLMARMENLESNSADFESLRKVEEAGRGNFNHVREWSGEVNSKLRTLFDLISKQSARADTQDKNLKSLNDYIQKLVKQLNENRR